MEQPLLEKQPDVEAEEEELTLRRRRYKKIDVDADLVVDAFPVAINGSKPGVDYGIEPQASDVSNGSELAANFTGIVREASDTSNGGELVADASGIVPEPSAVTNDGEVAADYSGIVPEASDITNGGELAADLTGIGAEASAVPNGGVITGIVPEASAVTNGGEIAAYDTGIESQISLELGGGPEAENGEDNSEFQNGKGGYNNEVENGKEENGGEHGSRSSVYFDKLEGIGSTDGVSGIQSEKIASAGSSDLYGEDLKNANISGTSSTYETLLKISVSGPKEYDKGTDRVGDEDVDFVDEIEEEPTDLDVEGVLKKQNTHDLYCPNCHSCITRRVILLRKKPKIRRKQRPERKLENNPASVRIEVRDIANISSNSCPTPAAPDDQNYDGEREAFRCLSCLSFFIPAGDGFRIFKAFGESKKNEILPAPEPVHQGRTNWFFSIFAPREKKTAFDQGQSLSEAATIGQRVQSQSPDDMSASYQRDQMGASIDNSTPAYHGESANPPKELIAEAKTVKQAVSGQNDFSSLKGASSPSAELSDQGKQVYELTGTQKSGKGGSNSFTDIPIFIAVGERSDGAMIDDNKVNGGLAQAEPFSIGGKVYGVTGLQKSGKDISNSATEISIFSAVAEKSDVAIMNDNIAEGDSTLTEQPGGRGNVYYGVTGPQKTGKGISNSATEISMVPADAEKSDVAMITDNIGVSTPTEPIGIRGIVHDGITGPQKNGEVISNSSREVSIVIDVKEKPIGAAIKKNLGLPQLEEVKTENVEKTSDSLMKTKRGEDLIVVMEEQSVQTTNSVMAQSTIVSREASSTESRGVDILKSIVYGGLIESITSLGVVSSAAGAGAATLNILALGLANLIGGLFMIIHNLRELKKDQSNAVSSETNTQDRYYELLGRRGNFALHATLSILSYLLFGLIPPVIYGFSFRESNNRDYKLAMTAGASLVCIILLALGKAHVGKPQRTYFKTMSYYVIIGFMASGASYLAGELLKKLMEELGWFDSSSPVAMPFSEAKPLGRAWAYY